MINEVSLEIIKKCPNKCLHCSSSSTLESSEIMPLSVLESVISGLSSLGAKEVSLSGGEPLLHPNVVDIVGYAVKHNFLVNIYSCGIMRINNHSGPIGKTIMEALKNAGLSKIIINLPAANEIVYDEISGITGHFPFATQSIKNSVSISVPTEIHFVPMKINKDEINSIISFGAQNNIDQISFLKLVPHGRARQNIERIMLVESEDLLVQKALLNYKKSGASIRIGIPYSVQNSCSICHAVREKLYIRYDGCVFGCEAFKYIPFFDGDGNPILPNSIYVRSIEEIVDNSPYLSKSKEFVERYSNIKPTTDACPVQKYLKETRKKNELSN